MLAETWVPQAAALGLKRLAIVLPESRVAEQTVEVLLKRYREHLEARSFTSLQEAEAWLREDAAPSGAAAGSHLADGDR